jgi:phage terminase small subunit
MALTARQRKFIDAYLVSGNATSAAVAAGYSEKTAGSIGSENLQKPEILAEVRSRQVKASESADLTLESHLAALNALKVKAAAANQFSAAVSAEVSRGKASGFYVEKSETKHSGAIQVLVRIAREGRRVTSS